MKLDIGGTSDTFDVCQGPWIAFESVETLLRFVDDDDTSSVSASSTSAETEEMPSIVDRKIHILLQ